jgi:hypothetical protein
LLSGWLRSESSIKGARQNSFLFISDMLIAHTRSTLLCCSGRPVPALSTPPPPFNGPDENAFNCSATWWWLGRPNPKRMRYRQTLINLDTRRKKSKHKIPGNT